MERINDAVQPPKWSDALPRLWYKNKTIIRTSQHWFDVYMLPCGGYAIYEPGHFQEVISFLLLGNDYALLWDTGMGIGNMRSLVEELTDLPLFVVNSHTHFDHMGGNFQFDQIYAADCESAKRRITNGLTNDKVVEHTSPEQYVRELPHGFEPALYSIRGSNYTPIANGHVFDLGERRLEVIYTPGHSPDSIMLYDKVNNILLTGDTFYPATLYAHLDAGDGMISVFSEYKNTMNRLANQIPDVKMLYCSHNEPVVDGKRLADVAEAFNAIAGGNTAFQTDDRGLRLYSFNGFAIVVDPKKLD